MNRLFFQNFIVISGSGKKVGKTFLACSIIKHFSSIRPVIGLKVSPHKHDMVGTAELIFDSGKFRIFKETMGNYKNSGKYLEAGAVDSYFVETEDGFLPEAFRNFSEKCNPGNYPVVCESGAMGTVIKPGIMIFIDQPGKNDDWKESVKNLADLVIPARTFLPAEITGRIELRHSAWILLP